MTDEYIRKQDVVDVASEDGKKIPTVVIRIMHDIKALPPADVVPVVRCKNCLFFTTEKSCCRPEGLIKAREDDFCSYGERREE